MTAHFVEYEIEPLVRAQIQQNEDLSFRGMDDEMSERIRQAFAAKDRAEEAERTTEKAKAQTEKAKRAMEKAITAKDFEIEKKVEALIALKKVEVFLHPECVKAMLTSNNLVTTAKKSSKETMKVATAMAVEAQILTRLALKQKARTQEDQEYFTQEYRLGN